MTQSNVTVTLDIIHMTNDKINMIIYPHVSLCQQMVNIYCQGYKNPPSDDDSQTLSCTVVYG